MTAADAPGELMVSGGRLSTEPLPDGTVRVTVTGGRLARRLDDHRAVVVCGECYEAEVVELASGQPLSNADIGQALIEFDHECNA